METNFRFTNQSTERIQFSNYLYNDYECELEAVYKQVANLCFSNHLTRIVHNGNKFLLRHIKTSKAAG